MKVCSFLVVTGIFWVNMMDVIHADYPKLDPATVYVSDTVLNIRRLIASAPSVHGEPPKVATCRSSLDNFTDDVIRMEPYALRGAVVLTILAITFIFYILYSHL